MTTEKKGGRRRRHKLTGIEKKEALTGYLFVLPYILLFIVFTGIPFFSAFLLSFVNVTFISRIENLQFVGLEHFFRLFQDTDVLMALGRTFLYTILYVPLIMVVGFALAYILNKGVFFKKLNRSLMFLPYVSNMVAAAVVFKLILGPRGPFYLIQQFFGSQDPTIPLIDLKWALPTVVVIAVWKGMGLNIITYLGALQNVPGELLEAAQIDGATRWQQIRHIVIPSVSPTTFFLLISSIITSLQNFTVIMALTEGGPGRATTTMSLSIVQTAFARYETSYASAQALLVFAIVMIFTLIQWQGQKKWVNY